MPFAAIRSGTIEAIGRRIKDALAREFSPVLTCSIGVASTEMLAKIGAELNKPDGLIMLHDEPTADRLDACV